MLRFGESVKVASFYRISSYLGEMEMLLTKNTYDAKMNVFDHDVEVEHP